MEIISVGETNWEELKAIRLASLKESPDAFSASYEAALNFSESAWRARASGREGCNFFIAKIDSQSVGVIGGFHKTGQYELISMWVSPSQRGGGVAQLLVNRVIQHAKELNHSSIFLEVSSDNISACRLYEKCGFNLISTGQSTVNKAYKIFNKLQFNLNY